MDINFMLNHLDEEHVSYVPTEEESLEWITNLVLLAEDDDDDDSFETQAGYVDDVVAMLNQLHNVWLQQSNNGNDFFTRVIQKMKEHVSALKHTSLKKMTFDRYYQRN